MTPLLTPIAITLTTILGVYLVPILRAFLRYDMFEGVGG